MWELFKHGLSAPTAAGPIGWVGLIALAALALAAWCIRALVIVVRTLKR
jgi:hypothetical protein